MVGNDAKERDVNRRFPVAVAAITAAAVIGGLGGAGLTAALVGDNGGGSSTKTTSATSAPPPVVRATDTARTTTSALTIHQIYERTSPGVVQIRVQGSSGAVTGSGFVFDRKGHVLTNEHVVSGASTATVVFANGKQESANVVGSDASTDVAVLQLTNPSSTLTPLPLGTATSLEIGDPVVAIGSPFGLQGTVTSGIVSALHRELQAPNGFAIDGAIQTDAALNSGNSGGPLLDDYGRVVGINSQIQSENGGNVGIGYAVPIDTAKRIAQQLIANGRVEHAYLGVQLAAVDSARGGARISATVAGGAAASAGMRAGDVVTAVDGKRIVSGSDLRAAVDARKPGDAVTLSVRRADGTHTVRVVLGTRPSQAQ
jgi:putative serine protease PepD